MANRRSRQAMGLRPGHWRARALTLALAGAGWMAAPDAAAIQTNWVTNGTGSWDDPVHWSAGVPADAYDALIGLPLAYVGYNAPDPLPLLRSLTLDSLPYAGPPGDPDNGKIPNLLHFAGTLATGSLVLGDGARGQIAQYGGTIQAADMTIARLAGSDSSLWMAGDAQLSAASMVVGGAGYASAFQTNANQVSVLGPLTIAALAGSVGQYQMSSRDPSNRLAVAGQLTVGSGGMGSFTQYAGLVDNTSNALYLGEFAGGSGVYTLWGGELNTGGMGVGEWGGRGEFQQFGGKVTVANDIGIARQNAPSASTGLWRMVGGELAAHTIQLGIDGDGEFWHYGGAVTTAGDLRIATGAGVGSGVYRMVADPNWGGVDPVLSVGMSMVVGEGRAGSFTQTLGTVNVVETVVLGQSATGIGQYRIEGGTLATANLYVGGLGRGEWVQTAGTVQVRDTLALGSVGLDPGAPSGQGRYRLEGGLLVVTGETRVGNGGYGAFDQTGGTVQNSRFTVGRSGTGELNLSGGTITGGMIEVYGPAPGSSNGSGVLRYSGGTLEAQVSNDFGRVEVSGVGERSFTGQISNRGLWQVSGTQASYTARFDNHGEYRSQASSNLFADLHVGFDGYLVGDAGSHFGIELSMTSFSQAADLWDTHNAHLLFTQPGMHEFWLTGADFGRSLAGYDNNFAWGSVQVDSGSSLVLYDGNADPGAALYVGTIAGLAIVGDTVTNVHGQGFNIYYLPAANLSLGGRTFALADGGTLAPVPEPRAWQMLAAGLAGMGLVLRRRRQR